MGYQTDFDGKFKLNKQLSLDDFRYLNDFNGDRHEGGDFPGYYCQWRPTEDGWFIEWDEGEKFYEYVEWIEWLIENFFKPKNYILNGTVKWFGEENGDVGEIIIKNNEVKTREGVIKFDSKDPQELFEAWEELKRTNEVTDKMDEFVMGLLKELGYE